MTWPIFKQVQIRTPTFWEYPRSLPIYKFRDIGRHTPSLILKAMIEHLYKWEENLKEQAVC